MSSVANGFSCFGKPAVAVRDKCDPDVVHGGVWTPAGDVEIPRLEDTRLARSVDDGSISMPSVTSRAEVILGFCVQFACLFLKGNHEMSMTLYWLNSGTCIYNLR